MSLTAQQIREVAQQVAEDMFVRPNAVASLNLRDIEAAVAAVDAFLEAAKDNFYHNVMPEPFNGTVADAHKAALLVYVASKRAGLR